MLSQDAREIDERSKGAIFVGMMHRAPYFLDFGILMNPHVFICGVTGSGKTYLMRNLMLKLWATGDALILVLDFTGEYATFAESADEAKVGPENIEKLLVERNKGILYCGMKGMGTEETKVRIAENMMSIAAEHMRTNDGTRRVFILLDEAWKLLKDSVAFETLLREGRKYGYGLVFSSQLVEDMDLAMLSNAASVFLFRLQNKRGLERLATNYGLNNNHVSAIQGLPVGSCMVIQVLATGKKSVCLIGKVHGVDTESTIYIALGDSVRLEIGRHRFEKTIRRNCGEEALNAVLALNGSENHMELTRLVTLLLAHCGSDAVLAALRGLGVDEENTADAFAVALTTQVDTNDA